MSEYPERIYFAKSKDGRDLSLYRQMRDGRPVHFWICADRRKVFTSTNLDHARTTLDQYVRDGLPDAAGTPNSEALIDRIESGKLVDPLPSVGFDVLVRLRMRALERGGSERQAKNVGSVITTVGPGEVPLKNKTEFKSWLDQAISAIASDSESAETLKKKLGFLVASFRHAGNFGCLAWAARYLRDVEDKAKLTRETFAKQRKQSQPRPPFTLKEIDDILALCGDFDKVCLVGVYLSGTFRGGEGERLEAQRIGPDGTIDLRHVVTKVKIKTLPHAPLVVRACAAFLDGRKPELPGKIDRQRFRATCATYLVLAGVPLMEIAARGNWTDFSMLEKHYARNYPEDYAPGTPLQAYLGFGGLKEVVGTPINESLWDAWVLRRIWKESERFQMRDSYALILRTILKGPKTVDFEPESLG